ncbi:hypothetical protein P691DRAFT_777536 [Macrolepiota fuliginosa MF-IS2]|uniref:MHD domain-containing protein n=1 Tax=Macrolepiota fuliginosa MF-IS2 TaxID=1400762 RepID=A0A9P5X6L1_9AGAR|nr:hypothetical protein P691DRAFT_777536 [Macrolepiota fuliginosa MF-IS2]
MNMTACSHCHQTQFYKSPPPTRPFLGSQLEEVIYIYEETFRLEELIAQFNEERAALLRRLNIIQSPTIGLPTEILSTIFEHTCPPPDFRNQHEFPPYGEETEDEEQEMPFQLVLGAVSSHWRRVVRSSPRLWTSVFSNIGVSPKKFPNILRLFIENSKHVPLSLVLRFLDSNPMNPFLVHPSIDLLIIEALPRIRELHLVNPPRIWHAYLPCLTRLAECSLNLSRPEAYVPDQQVMLPLIAPLRRLSLQEALWRTDASLQLPFLAITSLTLSEIPPDLSVQVFLQCPNLVEFHCISYSVQLPPPKPVTLTNDITFQYLKIFDWETRSCPWSHALVRYLTTPILRELRIFAMLDPTECNSQEFYNRLPPTLTKLELLTPSHVNYVRDDSNIEDLRMLYCNTEEVFQLFQRLRPIWRDGKLVKTFPRLRKLTIGEGGDDLDLLPVSCSIAVLEMLEKRLDSSTNSFHLVLETSEVDWLPEVEGKLKELKQAGFDLKIIECGAYNFLE